MNTYLIVANVLIFFTFIAHTFGGDREYKNIEPNPENQQNQIHWTMGRGAFHIVSADFLLATIGLTLVNFSNYFQDENLILKILTIYFSCYGLAFLLTLILSKNFSGKFIKLWQWLLMFIIAGLIYAGTN